MFNRITRWRFNVYQSPPRSTRYYQVFGREPQYPWPLYVLQFIFCLVKCFIYYGLIFLLIKWYLWPLIGSSLTKYSLIQATVNRSSILIDRLTADRKLS